MAPIQLEKSYVKVSSTPAAKCSRQARSSSRSWDVFLPISRRGSFFQDSFFSDIHKDFDSSVREVLARWSDEDLKGKDFRRDDIMDRYRQLRSRNLKEGNQAVTVTSDNTSHKIVLDVHDFMCGDVKVKVLDEEELLVEGHVEKKEEGSSSVSSHSFRRYFSLPQHTDMATITSVMSADGILTITAPKIKTETTKENATSQTFASNYREKVSETQKQMEFQKDSEHSSSTRKETCSCDFGSKRTADSSRFRSDSWDTFLPITRRGAFFQDSFFSGIHRDFDASIRKVLNGWNDADLHLKDCWDDDDFHRSDRLGRYRQLRSRNLWSDNQAVTVTSDNINYKIVLDMHDFMDGDVKVKLIGEELLVEAHAAMSSHTFRRSFSLPESFDITSIKSVMSSDGILTITASKKESETQQKTTVIPISVMETEDHSSTSWTASGVSDEAVSAQGMYHTAQEEERKYARCHRENIDENMTQTSNISSNTQQSLQKQSSVIADFASTRISDSLEGKKTLGNTQEDSLPIARRGSFFQDSFFSDLRQGFDASVREILKKCNLTVTDDVSHSDILSRYRQLRSRNMREENQAFSVLSDNATLKIVLDVHDFMCGDVKVKIVDEKELVVEGCVEKEEGSLSVSSHSFRRRFSLPHHTDMTRITSVMSSDGILTITALKMAGEPQQNTHVNFSMTKERKGSTFQNTTPEAVSSMTEKNISVHENLVNVAQTDFECERKHTYENKTKKLKKEFEFPAESNEVLKSKICHNQSVDESTTASDHQHSNDSNNQDHELKRLAETFESTITGKASCDDLISTHKERQTSVQSESESTEAIKLCEEILPITRRGSFVQDSFFLDVHHEFYTAIKEVLKKWVIADSETTGSEDFLSLSHSDILDRYRQLRSRDLREETQVSAITSDNTSYKIVLDVQDFMNRDLKVKVVGETKVVVEGRMARREEGNSSGSSCSFRRWFSLPEYIDMTTIMCFLSSDGILTIIASKMAEESEEYKVITSTEEVQESRIPTNETTSLHEECHDSDFDFGESQNQSKETISTLESSITAEAMANDSPSVSDEMQFYSLCRRSSIVMNDNSSVSRDFGTSSRDSLLSVIPEEEKDSEIVEVLHLEDSQQPIESLDLKDSQESINILDVSDSEGTVEILDLTDSQESVDIFDVNDSQETVDILQVKGTEAVEVPDLKDSQESINIFYQKNLEEVFDLKDSDVEILDLKDSKESVAILDVKDSQEAVAEAQNTSEAQNSQSILDDVTEDAVSVQERSKTVSEEALDSEMNQLATTESCTDSLQSSGDSCTYEKEAVDTLGQLKLKETTETVRTGESTETVESLKGTGRVHRDSTDELLLITKRGNFFQDSFFLDAHRDFSVALRQVLDRCNEVNFKDDINLRYTDILERYRQLRSRDLKEEDQAVIVTSDKSCLKIILDVYEFMSGDIQARVVDEKELVIEGRVVKSEGTSSETSHSFRRSFSLPQYTDITSVMSLDGILTVTVIFKEGNVELNTAKNSIKTEGKCNITKEIIESQSPSLSAEKRVFEAKTENQDGLNKYVTLQSEESRNFSRDFVSGTEISKIASNFEDNNRLRRFGQECDRESQEANKYNVTEDTSSGTSSRFTSIYQSNSALKSFPVTRRGLFFSDYFFRDTREDFQKAVREVLSKWGEKSSHGDEMTCYRKLRARNMREDNQAVTSSDDEHHYKFVIDVQDFMDVGEISVKAVNERELVVEGRLEKKEDGSKSSKRFLRRFTAPGDIELEAVISVMSSDGVLKILAPKREVYNRKYVSTEVEDMDDGDATFSRKFTKGHCLADDILRKRDSSSDDEEFKAFARHVNDRYQVTFQDDDEDLDSENGYMLNKEAKMKTDKYNIPSFSAETRVLHIDRRGLFTEDYFFANVRHSYSQAVREVLEKANEWTCRSDAMDNYRRLRQRNLKLETQAVGILDDQDSHRIVMDIFDFIKGDVTVQLVKGKELLVEGQAEKQDGSRMSQVSFERRFALPDLVERDAISCVLSSDGILTITSKKRACGYRAMARGFSSERKSHGDTAGKWEDKKVKDSLADLEGPSSRAFCTGSRSHYHSSYAKHY